MVFGCLDVSLTIPWECLPFLIRSQIGQDAHREREGVGGGWWWQGGVEGGGGGTGVFVDTY